jgi:hypothetical protein
VIAADDALFLVAQDLVEIVGADGHEGKARKMTSCTFMARSTAVSV